MPGAVAPHDHNAVAGYDAFAAQLPGNARRGLFELLPAERAAVGHHGLTLGMPLAAAGEEVVKRAVVIAETAQDLQRTQVRRKCGHAHAPLTSAGGGS